MKITVQEREEIEYDFDLEYFSYSPCPFQVGDKILNPVIDGCGKRVEFTGTAHVVYIVTRYFAGYSKTTVFVKQV